MVDQFKTLVAFVARLESLLRDYDEFQSVYETNSLRLELVKRFSPSPEEEETQLQDLASRIEEAKIYGEGLEVLIQEHTSRASAEDARQYLTELKTLLNATMEAVSSEFANAYGLTTKTAEEIVSLGISLLPR